MDQPQPPLPPRECRPLGPGGRVGQKDSGEENYSLNWNIPVNHEESKESFERNE